MESPTPTPTQQKMIDIIIDYIEETGSSPTLRYLQVEMGYRSTNAVRDMLNRLVRKGHLLEVYPRPPPHQLEQPLPDDSTAPRRQKGRLNAAALYHDGLCFAVCVQHDRAVAVRRLLL
jgi:SOS-response transcriptional repressor LexA